MLLDFTKISKAHHINFCMLEFIWVPVDVIQNITPTIKCC